MNDGQSNHGFLWILNPEQKWRSVFAASSYYSDAAKRPKLVINYVPMKKYFYLKDHLGNIRVTVDENGDVKGYNDYYPFGLRMPGRSMNTALNYALYKFSGKELDEENGINWYYFGARYYDPATGRWLSVDPAEIQWSPRRIIAYQLYAVSPYVYVRNNPLNRFDPDGLIDRKLVSKGVLKFTGGLLGTIGSGYAIVQSGGAAAAFGGTVALTTSIGSMNLGMMDIINGFRDEPSALPDGLFVTALTKLGVDKQASLTINTIYDFISLVKNIGAANSKAGTIIDELKVILSTTDVTDDVKAQIKEYLKELEKNKIQEEERKRQKEEERKEKEEEN